MLTVSLHCKLQDHLHIRGEYRFLLIFCFGHPGSPPHTWRIPDMITVTNGATRITSTYVENTFTPFGIITNGIGSPPHTWRIQPIHDLQAVGKRITSTYVENTFSICCLLARLRDHLHIRGEYFGVVQLVHITKGSPPHTWRILLIKVF